MTIIRWGLSCWKIRQLGSHCRWSGQLVLLEKWGASSPPAASRKTARLGADLGSRSSGGKEKGLGKGGRRWGDFIFVARLRSNVLVCRWRCHCWEEAAARRGELGACC